MNDAQVQGEMRKMVAFIKQEALEKSKEIHIKADEEFAIEKAKLVRQEQSKVDEQHEARIKKAGMSQQIARSTVLNKQRLKVLQARQAAVDDIFEQARKSLAEISKDAKSYEDLLSRLILQGLLKIMGKKVTVSARENDYDVVKKAIESAKKSFKDKSGIDADVSIDEDSPLPEKSAGGVIVKANKGTIRCDNTLEGRLLILETDALPLVRAALFGESQTRKFKD
ncbi:V-ATPase V1 sector subunit E [Savitreella phatthalungensis]